MPERLSKPVHLIGLFPLVLSYRSILEVEKSPKCGFMAHLFLRVPFGFGFYNARGWPAQRQAVPTHLSEGISLSARQCEVAHVKEVTR